MHALAHYSSLDAAARTASALVWTYMNASDAPRVLRAAWGDGAKAAHKALLDASKAADEGGGTVPCAVVFDVDDTLLLHDGAAIGPMVALARALHAMGAVVHIVTASEDASTLRAETEAALARLGVVYKTLWMTNSTQPRGWEAISKWKGSCRAKIERAHKAPVVLSIGDVFGDMTLVKSEKHMDALETQRKASVAANVVAMHPHSLRYKHTLYRLAPADHALWGLKLPIQFRVKVGGKEHVLDEEEMHKLET